MPRAGQRSSGEGKRVWETLHGARGWGFPLTPRGVLAVRGLESLACHGVPRRTGGDECTQDLWISLFFTRITAGLSRANQIRKPCSPNATGMGSGQLSATSGCPQQTRQQQMSIISRINAQLQRGVAQPRRNSVFLPSASASSVADTEQNRWSGPQRGSLGPSLFPRARAASFFRDVSIRPSSTQSFWNRKASTHHRASPDRTWPRQCWALVGLSVCVTLSGMEPGLDGSRVPARPAKAWIWLWRGAEPRHAQAPCCNGGREMNYNCLRGFCWVLG